MREQLTYFIWSFQQQFRSAFQYETEKVLARVGLSIKPRALLIGFAASDRAKWPICVEPEYRFFQPSHFESSLPRGVELYEAHPDSSMWHSAPWVHDAVHAGLRDRCRADALTELLNQHTPEPVTYLVGRSTLVGDYHVHPALGVSSDTLKQIPQLQTLERDRVEPVRSLLHGCLDICLSLATTAMTSPDAGAAVLQVLGASADEIAQRAATRFVASSARLTGSMYGNDLYSALTALSTTRYEGAAGFGSIVIAQDGDPDVTMDVRLRNPVRLTETRSVRKLLEISDRDKLGLLSDGNVIYGLGRIEASYDTTTERIFDFHVVGQGQWLMRHGQDVLFETEFGNPRFRTERIDRIRFVDTAERLFGSDQQEADRLWDLAVAAADQAHGTMLVISASAAAEALRLSAQAAAIEPKVLPLEVLRQATAIDGAVLFSPDGTCHAFGVILDGTATDEGDRGRGARFNSAVRYLTQAAGATMIVLVSEDGMIDVLPRMRPRISRSMITQALESYQQLTEADDVDGELRADAFDRLGELAFYLDDEQCDRVNRIERAYQQRQLESGAFSITGRDLVRNPAMDDSYFLD